MNDQSSGGQKRLKVLLITLGAVLIVFIVWGLIEFNRMTDEPMDEVVPTDQESTQTEIDAALKGLEAQAALDAVEVPQEGIDVALESLMKQQEADAVEVPQEGIDVALEQIKKNSTQ